MLGMAKEIKGRHKNRKEGIAHQIFFPIFLLYDPHLVLIPSYLNTKQLMQKPHHTASANARHVYIVRLCDSLKKENELKYFNWTHVSPVALSMCSQDAA